MRTPRRYERFVRRLEVEFSAGDQTYRCISSNFSRGGLFIRTNHAFVPGTSLDLKVHLPDGTVSKLRGTVKMASKTPGLAMKNGMGVEIIESDSNYLRFISDLSAGDEGRTRTAEEVPESPIAGVRAGEQAETENPEFVFLSCPVCGARNRLVAKRLSFGARCGKCGSQLTATA